MPTRVKIELDKVACRQNLVAALWVAARTRRSRPEIAAFLSNTDRELSDLGNELLSEQWRMQPLREFVIRDPKRRMIHAPAFRDRVVHHAIIRQAGDVLERGLVDDTFACRQGRGPLRAVLRAQTFSRRYPWYVKVDVRQYFPSIDHEVLRVALLRRFKGDAFLRLLHTVIDGYCTTAGKGLPIGALTSQYFANLYLNAADRWIEMNPDCRSAVRYMDDIVIWADDRNSAIGIRDSLRRFVADKLQLSLKGDGQLNRSSHGLTFCGFRIFPGAIRLTLKRRRTYAQICRRWEQAFQNGQIGAVELQANYASAYSVAKHADAEQWRREWHGRRGSIDA